MLAVLSILFLSWVGVVTARLLAPTLRSTTAIAVGLGVSYATPLGAASVLLLLSGPRSLGAMPFLLGAMAVVAEAESDAHFSGALDEPRRGVRGP